MGICSIVCDTHASCLNHSTDVHAIRQLNLRGPRTHCVRWDSLNPKEKGRFSDWTHKPKIALAYLWFTRRQHRSAISPLIAWWLCRVYICVIVFFCSLLTWKPEQSRHPSESQSHRSSDIVEHSSLKDDVSCRNQIFALCPLYTVLYQYEPTLHCFDAVIVQHGRRLAY